MEWWQALILGIVEGLTEYLPVSSTGHLLLTQRALGLAEGDAANAYAICIQAGAIMAVLGLYAGRVRQMVHGLFGRDAVGLRLVQCVVVAFFPAAVIGLLFDDVIESHLFGLWPIVAAWFIGGLLILLLSRDQRFRDVERHGRELTQLTWQRALLIGFVQCLAMWPGTSRSLVTILAGVSVGLSMSAAVEFSFLLGVITLGAATGYKGLDQGAVMVSTYGIAALSVGFAAAWLSAVMAVRWMVAYLNRHGLEIFGYWRVGIAAIVGSCLWTGVL